MREVIIIGTIPDTLHDAPTIFFSLYRRQPREGAGACYITARRHAFAAAGGKIEPRSTTDTCDEDDESRFTRYHFNDARYAAISRHTQAISRA